MPFASPDDLAKVIDRGHRGPPLRLGDVADVVVDHQLLIGDAVSTSEGAGLLLVVEKLPGASAAEVTRELEAALETICVPDCRASRSTRRCSDPATFIETSDDNLGHRADRRRDPAPARARARSCSIGARPRSASSPSSSSLLGGRARAFAVRHDARTRWSSPDSCWRSSSSIDDAVGDVENVVAACACGQRDRTADVGGAGRSRGARRDAQSGSVRAADHAGRVRAGLLRRGAFGAFFPSIAVAYAAAVVTSMLVALAVTPALGLVLLSRRAGATARIADRPLARAPVRTRLSRGAWASAAPGLVAGRRLLLIAGLRCGAVPRSVAESDVQGHRPAGPPERSTRDVAGGDEPCLRPARERARRPSPASWTSVATPAARSLSDQVVSVDASELWVSIDPEADYDATVAAVRSVVAGYPGLDRGVVDLPRGADRAGPARDAETRHGADLRSGPARSSAARRRRSGRPSRGSRGSRTRRSRRRSEQATLEIEVDLDAAERYGIVPGDVRRAAAALLSGIQVGSLFDEQKVFEVVVWGTPEIRHDLSSVEDLSIDTPDGGQIRLGDVADVHLVATPTVIRHEAVSRSIDITAGVSGRDLDAVIDDVERGLQGDRVPARVPRRAGRRLHGRAVRRSEGPRIRDRRRDRHLPPAAGGHRQLAPGRAAVPAASP